jgi:hypothetical protein
MSATTLIANGTGEDVSCQGERRKRKRKGGI